MIVHNEDDKVIDSAITTLMQLSSTSNENFRAVTAALCYALGIMQQVVKSDTRSQFIAICDKLVAKARNKAAEVAP